MLKKTFFPLIVAILVLTPCITHGASLNPDKYPKLANIFFRWDISASEAQTLARWDILLIDMDVQTYTPDQLRAIKKINPNIKILAYLASQDIRYDSCGLNGTLRQKLCRQIDPSWWLKDTGGNKISWWPVNPIINITNDVSFVNNQQWPDVLSHFIKDNLMDSGLWDGVFLDNGWDDLTFMQKYQIDLNQDGIAESMDYINQKWQAGMNSLLSKTRQLIGPDKLIITNGGERYYQYINGVLYESFPNRGWAATMQKYRKINQLGYAPAVGILNTNVDNTGTKNNYQKMRFGLTSALLDDGYYSFDNGDQSHCETWWYDEYEIYLGQPANQAVNILNKGTDLSLGVWRRDFKQGLVLVNSTKQSQEVDLGGEYEKLSGTQDPNTNDGSFVSEITLAPQDGIVLLRPIDKILNAVYANGSFAKVFNEQGHSTRVGFFAYDGRFRGGSQIVERDINNDLPAQAGGAKEFIVASGNRMEIYGADKQLQESFYPYGEKYNGSISFAVGDLYADGKLEIVTGRMSGEPQVRVFDADGNVVDSGFYAFDKKFKGLPATTSGINIALGDLQGDGQLEIVAGLNSGASQVVVLTNKGKLLNSFYVFDKRWRLGVNVAVGDVDTDGNAEIVTGAGKNGGPQVSIFDATGKLKGARFFAFDQSQRQGVGVIATDIDGDGKAEIIAETADVFTLARNNAN